MTDEEPPERVSIYGFRYFKEGATIRVLPLMSTLERTLRIARLGLIQNGAESVRIIDTSTGAEVAFLRRDT